MLQTEVLGTLSRDHKAQRETGWERSEVGSRRRGGVQREWTRVNNKLNYLNSKRLDSYAHSECKLPPHPRYSKTASRTSSGNWPSSDPKTLRDKALTTPAMAALKMEKSLLRNITRITRARWTEGRANTVRGTQTERKGEKVFMSNIRKMHEGAFEYEIRKIKEEEKRQQFIRDIQQQIDEKRERKGKENTKERATLSRGGSQATTAVTNDIPENVLQFKNKSKSE